MRKSFTLFFALFLSLAVAQGVPSAAAKLKRMPAAVRQTVHEQLGDSGKLGRVAKSAQDGQTVWEVTINQDGKSRDYTIALNGAVLEKQVFLEEVPKAVQKTILETAHGPVDDITQTTDEGEINYDVEVSTAGVTRDFTVGAGGELLSVEIPLSDAPAAVQKTVHAKTEGATRVKVNKSTEDGETIYNVEMTKDGQEQDFDLSADGKVRDKDIRLEDTPALVRKTIQTQAGTDQIGDITQSTDEDGVHYDAEITDDRGLRDVTVNADGTVDSIARPIALTAAPAPVQSAITREGGTVVDINRVTAGGQVSYDVEITKAGATHELSFTPEGKSAEP